MRGVQHRQRQLLLGRPVLPLDLEVGQPQAGHGDDGQRGVGAEQVPGGAAEEQQRQRHLGGVEQQVAEFLGVVVGRGLQAGDDVVQCGRLLGRHLRTACRSSGRGRRLPGDLRRHQHRADVLHQHPALGAGVGDGDLVLPVAGRRRSGSAARCGVGISAYGASVPCSEPVRLSTRENGRSSGICAQPGQRAGRVEQRHLDAAAGGQVAERAEQRRLATARLGDEHGRGRSAPAPPSGSAGRGRPAGGEVPAVRPIRSPRRSPTVDAACGSAAASSLTGIRRR